MPSDVEIEIGQAFSQTYGQIKGANSDQALMVVDLGSASDFVTWDSDSNTLRVEAGATDLSSIGKHTISMIIFDQSNESGDIVPVKYDFTVILNAPKEDPIIESFCNQSQDLSSGNRNLDK